MAASLLTKKHGQAMTEFVLILPACMLLLLGITQFAVICVNALLVKYAAYTVARAAVSYVEERYSKEVTNNANTVAQEMIDTANRLGSAYKTVVTTRTKDMPVRPTPVVTNMEFPSSDYVYKKVVITYNVPLRVPIVNKVFGVFPGNVKINGEYYMPVKASAIMHSGVLK